LHFIIFLKPLIAFSANFEAAVKGGRSTLVLPLTDVLKFAYYSFGLRKISKKPIDNFIAGCLKIDRTFKAGFCLSLTPKVCSSIRLWE
jgi:hypothetical protein